MRVNKMSPATHLASSLMLFLGLAVAANGVEPAFRPPSVPLVTSDPFLSIWSDSDRLTDTTTRHWTHREHSLVSLIRIDGKTYRLMGNKPALLPAFPQVSLEVRPTHTIYNFSDKHVNVTLTFMSPALPNDLEAFSLPLTYLTWQVNSVDGAKHDVSLFDSTSSQLTVTTTDEKVNGTNETAGSLTTLRIGTVEQPVLGSAGDNHHLDWGYAYAAASTKQSTSAIGAYNDMVEAFVSYGKLPAQKDSRLPRAVNKNEPVMAFAFDLGAVSAKPVTRQVIVAYDEIYEIKYFGQNLRPYWKRNDITAGKMLSDASRHFADLEKRCVAFDAELMADATKAGGVKYAQITALAYRECIAACGLAADPNKQPLFFTKENTSNGDICTVDVFFPMAPQWVLLSPTLTKASIAPILSYAASWHWKFPNAPHDLGTYPIARGTDDGGEGMPVEESGNMLILCDAIAHQDGNANFCTPWWPQLTEWAQYLEKYGLDPEGQLCTDDFMGHLAHNSNLSIKAILGLAAYGDLCKIRGDKANAQKYHDLAVADAKHWMQAAAEGDHYNLAFDRPGTWSQKYNLVWDKILGLNIFPAEVAQKEVAHYKSVMQRYGVPLDSRTKLTKTDWSFWVATLAEKQTDFETIINPTWDYLNETTARDPLADSYVTDDIHSGGMHARPVVGGLFVKMLADPILWKKWSSRDHAKFGALAPLPLAPIITDLIPTSAKEASTWRYTIEKPAQDWTATAFDASAWREGQGAFGSPGTPSINPRTEWRSGDIWLRREVTMPEKAFTSLKFVVFHDEELEVYVNGVLAGSEKGYVSSYGPLDITPQGLALLKPGAKVTLAVHCHQTEGGQGVDVGLANVIQP